ncbi:23S rRNA (uracil(1939)-C(5))-methyltransferase RlmD [Haliangium ochraceum]|uniref:(Uracil-5)-methyltransferase n=1 Tax=Haliangium ochraceum (strain DSM 14365 / JCM 11303 / SMP-2) TaxID=502025 RepID=D0LWB0_HALO1|nr:23S rRNA (uracil(1939)-C(5))-methyltransferase RlmD [Haliangium ochraceum]ACY16042.1 (Uracil-5)-methyltransferase [Haliangium ochraceum DSM 14365]
MHEPPRSGAKAPAGRGRRPLRRGQRVTLSAADIDDAGCGVGEVAGVAVAAFDLLPGESAEVEIEHLSPHRARAWARRCGPVATPAEERVAPPCPGFGRCGGCVWQHLAYPAQLAHKRARVARAFADAGLAVEVAAPLAAPATTGYRNKGKYVIGTGADGLVLGAFAPRSHVVVDTAGCQVLEPAIERVARHLRTALAASRLPVYDERTRRGTLRYAILRSGADGRVLVGVVIAGAGAGAGAPAEAEIADALAPLRALDEVAGAVLLHNDTRSGALIDGGERARPLFGASVVIERLDGPGGPGSVAVALGIEAFFQVHRAQARRLYREVATAAARLRGPGADGDRAALDLYCGVGGVAFALAGDGGHVVGVESNPSAVAAARDAAAGVGAGANIDFALGDAADFGRLSRDLQPSLVAVNPPRAGLRPEARDALLAAAPPALVYVSCGPSSLARDVAAFTAAGYEIERVLPVDLMPGTPQIETVATLRRCP